MNGEIHLFIIWSKALEHRTKILENLRTRFVILGVHDVTWNKENFAENLTRFYGENLPKNSKKERLCGNDTFLLIVVLDEQPLYRVRMTSKGPKQVNVNMFDSKEMYRHWTGGGHKIHGTNSVGETKHDLVLLTGYSIADYLHLYEKNDKNILTMDFTQMPGENGWKSINELLYVLNETTNYVVLRNFDGLFYDYNKSVHGDIDILCDNYYSTSLILNAQPVHRSKYRVQNIVKVGDGGTYFDIRHVGDRYYCKQWEESILANRIWCEDGYYRPNNEEYLYALVYHALVQKQKISEDYMDIFERHFEGLSAKDEQYLQKKLFEYMERNAYVMEEPVDYSVYFSEKITGQKMSFKKYILKKYHRIFK